MSNNHDQIKLVVAGSYHVRNPEGGYVNQSTMLNWQGKTVWEHRKQWPFELTTRNIDESPHSGAIRDSFRIGTGDDLVEEIVTTFPVTFVDTPVGRMTTLICLDFLQSSVGALLPRIPCDYFWVPAMTTNIEYFERDAITHGKKFRVVAACCASISCCELLLGKPSSFSFLYAGGKRMEKVPSKGSALTPLIIYEIDSVK